MSLLHDLFDFSLNASLSKGSTPAHPKDWALAAEMNEVLDYIAKTVPPEVSRSKATCEADVAKWEKDVEDANAKLSGLQTKIDAKIKKDQAAMSKVESYAIAARGKVKDAQNKVDQLQGNIDSFHAKIHALHWYQKWKAPGYYIVIGALEVAKGTADLALEAVEALLADAAKALKASGKVMPDLDPEIIAWRAEYAIAHAALTAADEALKALGKGTCVAVAAVEDEFAKVAGTFLNIEHAYVSGSIQKLKQKDLADVAIKGIVLGKKFDKSFSLNLNLVDDLVGAIYSAIVHDHAPAKFQTQAMAMTATYSPNPNRGRNLFG